MQLLICEGKRVEGSRTRRLRVPSKDHMLTKPWTDRKELRAL